MISNIVETKKIDRKKEKNEDLRSVLLNQLPSELQEKWKEADVNKIQEIVNERMDLGLEIITGYHCSNKDLQVGDFIMPGDDMTVNYATDFKKLYGRKAKYLYILEGNNQDRDLDEGLGWKTSFSRMKIIGKVPLTHDKVDELDLGFAKCDYS